MKVLDEKRDGLRGQAEDRLEDIMNHSIESMISREDCWRSLLCQYENLTLKLRDFADTYDLSKDRQDELKIVNSILAPAMAMRRNEVDEYHDDYVYPYIASKTQRRRRE